MKSRKNAIPVDISWSRQLTSMTRAGLQKPLLARVHLCLKNCDGRFGLITTLDLIAHRWIVTDREHGHTIGYESARLLVAAGWVID